MRGLGAALDGSLLILTGFAVACGGQEASRASSDAGGGGGDAPLDVVVTTDAAPPDQGAPPDVFSPLDAPADVPQGLEAGGCVPANLTWSPSMLPGLVLWLEASTGISTPAGSPVSRWADQSPAHNDATQSLAGYQPTLVASSIGGLPAVRFDGNVTFLSVADSATLQWGTGDFALVAVATFTGTTTPEQMLYQKSPPAAPYNGPALYVNSDKPMQNTTATAQVSEYVFATSSMNGLQGTPHVLTARRQGTSLQIHVDGYTQGAATLSSPIDVSAQGRPAIIGQNGYNPSPGFQALAGDIAEMVAVQGTITDADMWILECHLLLKYGL